MLSVDSQRKHANRGNNNISSILITLLINLIHLPQMFSLTAYFIADNISRFQQRCLSHSLSLFLSPRYLALSPAQVVWYKNPGMHFHLIIDLNKLIWSTSLFHLEVANDICYEWNILKYEARTSAKLLSRSLRQCKWVLIDKKYCEFIFWHWKNLIRRRC
jgi:hypothetical protein